MRGPPGSYPPSAYGPAGDGRGHPGYAHFAGGHAPGPPGHYGYQPAAADYGGRAWPSYGHMPANETMAEMRGERTEHGLNSGHCLTLPPAGFPPSPMRPASPMRSVSPMPSRVDVATAHLRGHAPQVQRSNSYAATLPSAHPGAAPPPSGGMMSYDAALPGRSAGSAGMGSFAQPQIGVLPCRPLFPEASARPAPAPADARRPDRTPAPPPGVIGTNQFKDSSSYLESMETDSADELEAQSERTQALKQRQRNRSPSGRMQSCMPCLIMC